MATKVLSNEFMQNIATEEAWKELSSNFNWSETVLEKYQDKVDWDEISENRNIRWTIPMIQKFQKKINWDKFSDYADENILTERVIEAFKEKWNWHNLSNNGNVQLTDEPTGGIVERLLTVTATTSTIKDPSNSTRSIRSTSLLRNFRILVYGEAS